MSDDSKNMRGTRDSARRPNPDDPATITNPKVPGPSKPSNTDEHGPPSLASRVQSSAAGLARSALEGAGSPSDAARMLAGATQGKVAGPSALASAGSGNLASRDIAARGLNAAAGAGSAYSGPGVAGSFRSETSATAGGFEIPALSEEGFQRLGAYSDETSLQLDGGHGTVHRDTSLSDLQGKTGNWKGKQRAHDPMQVDYSSAWERADNLGAQAHTYEPQASDGAEVVSLLADTSFDPDFGGTEDVDLDMAAAPPPLTAAEIKMLDSFRRQIGDSDSNSQNHQPGLSSLSLVPDIDTFLQQNDLSVFSQSIDSRAASAMTLRDSVLEYLPGAEDWVTVHERYHDEVWGYLRPALEAAKAEIEEKGPDAQEGDENDGPAVRRLKMILKHMRA